MPHSPADAIGAFVEATDYPLLVITTIADGGQRSGCLAGFVTQCSIDPPRFLVCISRVNHTFDVVQRARFMVLHLLGERQSDLASRFGERTGDSVDKFTDVRWHPGPEGVPVLDECSAWVLVEILARFDVGDHQAVLAGPLDGGAGNQSGLLILSNAPPLDAGHPA
jgi:flavin reductase (DIM6/NTAB) family NADH-FMN oxidoreductase RutF